VGIRDDNLVSLLQQGREDLHIAGDVPAVTRMRSGETRTPYLR